MKVEELVEFEEFRLLNEGNNLKREISVPYCCDLLSIAMSRDARKCGMDYGNGQY